MKGLIIVPIENDEDEAYEEAFGKMSNAIIKARKEINNGTRMRVFNVDPTNAEDLNSHIGKIIRWSNGRGPEPYRKPKGFWSKLASEVSSIFNEEIDL